MRSCESHSFVIYYLYAIFIFVFVSSLSWLPRVDCDPLVSRSGEVLKVFVPKRTDFKEFVDCTDSANPKGFCIDVFNSAVSVLSLKHSWTSVNYTCTDIGDLSYDTLVDGLAASKDYDAVVGDVTVSAKRLMNVSFTQTYLDSGIVIVSLDRDISQRFPGVFFQPFSNETWGLLVGSIFLTGLTLWLLERSNTDPDPIQRKPSRLGKLVKTFWFVTSILIFLKRDKTKNPLTKFVMMAWILFLILFSSSYTATLSSILTVNERSQKALTLDDLIKLNKTIGFHMGSVVEDYLKDRHKSFQLKALYNVTQYGEELRSKNVSAIVEEIPYISLFLADQPASNCMFSVSQKLTIEGFGFAFYNESIYGRYINPFGERTATENARWMETEQLPMPFSHSSDAVGPHKLSGSVCFPRVGFGFGNILLRGEARHPSQFETCI
ncbi:hypothetical protein KP509_01G009300 [Ceratopteris richardii]|uniref:Ionotropic glutamate receptor C-terminal domain-containing protein n=1 Tax=Ceratopteris richardii TaxID=49495 RepID=A0A8T2VDZ5_CERRI|nr:hypothetical protein KP509_01G009300 [Ceratopteris richardii]